MSAWGQMSDARKLFFSLWVACGFVAFACSVAAVSGVEALRWIAVIFGLLAAHALTAWTAMGRIADLQAALDMKRIAVDALKYPELTRTGQVLAASGLPMELRARDGTRFKVYVTRINCAALTADMKVEYLG